MGAFPFLLFHPRCGKLPLTFFYYLCIINIVSLFYAVAENPPSSKSFTPPFTHFSCSPKYRSMWFFREDFVLEWKYCAVVICLERSGQTSGHLWTLLWKKSLGLRFKREEELICIPAAVTWCLWGDKTPLVTAGGESGVKVIASCWLIQGSFRVVYGTTAVKLSAPVILTSLRDWVRAAAESLAPRHSEFSDLGWGTSWCLFLLWRLWFSHELSRNNNIELSMFLRGEDDRLELQGTDLSNGELHFICLSWTLSFADVHKDQFWHRCGGAFWAQKAQGLFTHSMGMAAQRKEHFPNSHWENSCVIYKKLPIPWSIMLSMGNPNKSSKYPF